MFLTTTNPSITWKKTASMWEFIFVSITLRAGEYLSAASSWHPPPWPWKQIVLWLWTDGVTLPCLCLWSDLEMMAASCFNEWVRGRKCFAGSCMIWHTSMKETGIMTIIEMTQWLIHTTRFQKNPFPNNGFLFFLDYSECISIVTCRSLNKRPFYTIHKRPLCFFFYRFAIQNQHDVIIMTVQKCHAASSALHTCQTFVFRKYNSVVQHICPAALAFSYLPFCTLIKKKVTHISCVSIVQLELCKNLNSGKGNAYIWRKEAQISLEKNVYPLLRCFFRRIDTMEHYQSVMETLDTQNPGHIIRSLQMHIQHCDWTKEEAQYLLIK